MTVLRTDRLRLRPPEPGDVEPFARMCADPEVMRFVGAGLPLDRGSAELGFAVILDRWAREGTGLFTAEERAGGRYVGFVGTAIVPGRSVAGGEREIGWRLCRDAWGRGLATEGALAVRDTVTASLGLDALVALVRPQNARSRRVAEKLGMALTGEGPGPRGERVVVYRWRA